MTNQPGLFQLPLLDGGQIYSSGLGTYPHMGLKGVELFTQALRDGHRLVDTAAQYNNAAALGEAIKRSQVARSDLFVQTKIAGGDQGEATRTGLEESLRRLRLEYVDLTLIHWPNPSRGLYLRTWEELIKLREEGKTKHIGVSNFLPSQIDELIEHTGVCPVVNQIQLSAVIQQRSARDYHRSKQIVTQAWRPLGPGEDLLTQHLVVNIAQQVGRSPAQVVLRWALQCGVVPLSVSSKPERNRENLAIYDFSLSDAQMDALALLDTGGRFARDPMVHEEW